MQMHCVMIRKLRIVLNMLYSNQPLKTNAEDCGCKLIRLTLSVMRLAPSGRKLNYLLVLALGLSGKFECNFISHFSTTVA
jgi:hypothetical protein